MSESDPWQKSKTNKSLSDLGTRKLALSLATQSAKLAATMQPNQKQPLNILIRTCALSFSNIGLDPIYQVSSSIFGNGRFAMHRVEQAVLMEWMPCVVKTFCHDEAGQSDMFFQLIFMGMKKISCVYGW